MEHSFKFKYFPKIDRFTMLIHPTWWTGWITSPDHPDFYTKEEMMDIVSAVHNFNLKS